MSSQAIARLVAPMLLAAFVAECRGSNTPPPHAAIPVQELCLFKPGTWLRVRVTAEIAGEPLQHVWRRFFQALFAQLDRNDDKSLSGEEWKLAPSALCWRRLTWGYLPVLDHGRIPFADVDTNQDGEITPAEMVGWYQRRGLGYLQVGLAPEPSSAALSARLWKELDRDKSGQLAPAEYAGLPQLLQTLDVNNNELIDASELVPGLTTPYARASSLLSLVAAKPSKRVELGIMVVIPGETRHSQVEAILSHYDGNGDQKLSRTEGGLTKEQFALLDRDDDGYLCQEDLQAWLKSPVDLHLHWSRRAGDAACRVVQVSTQTKETLRVGQNGIRIANRQKQVEWQWELPSHFESFQQIRKSRLKVFRECDQDGDGLVSEKEAKQQVWLPSYLPLGDRDNDRQLSVAEFQAVLNLQAAFLKAHVFLGVRNHGRRLFSFVDQDKDGRLSRWELTEASVQLGKLGSPRNVFVEADLPVQLQFVLTCGPLWIPGTSEQYRPVVRQGPTWFLGMDENRDGVISRREFIGNAGDFRRLDSNDNGMIERDEARTAGR